MTTCGNRRAMGENGDNRGKSGTQVGFRVLELRQFRWAKGIRSPFRVVLSPRTLSVSARRVSAAAQSSLMLRKSTPSERSLR
jgi:hypothetical protein